MMITKIKNELKQGKNFLSFSTLKILSQAILFIIPLIIAKLLNPAGFGSYSLSMMVIFIFTSMFIASSQTPFIIYANKELKKTKKINKAFSIQLIFLLGSIIFYILLTLLFSEQVLNFTKITNIQLLFLFLAYLGIGLKTFIENLFLALNKRINNGEYNLVLGIFNLIFILLVYCFDKICLETIFFTYFLSSIFALILFLRKIEYKKLFPLKLDKPLFKEMFDFTKWQMMGLTAVYFINWGDNLVLRYFVSMEEIGVYNLGYQIFKGLISLTFIINAYFLPFVSQNIDNKDKMKNYLYKKRPKIFLFGFLGIIIIFLDTPLIFNLIYKDVYLSSVVVLRVLLIACVLHLYSVFYIPMINSLKNYKFAQKVNIFVVLINIGLDIIFVYSFGIIGAAIGTVIAYMVSVSLYYLYFKKIGY